MFGDLVALHRKDLQEAGKEIGRSKTASLIFLDGRIGRLRLPELDSAEATDTISRRDVNAI